MIKNINTPKGTRDFNNDIIYNREFIIDKIRDNFIRFGFLNLETPTIENLKFMQGNYGQEGDKLMYKIRSNKSIKDNLTKESLEQINSIYKGFIPDESKLVLRYDLTMPLARYIAQNMNDISFPFKRFQIQNVFRADRPQKGRWREFLQCDADIVGSDSNWSDIELIQLYDRCFADLGLKGVVIRINNRKILQGINNLFSQNQKFNIVTLFDKSDKMGMDYVIENMRMNNIDITNKFISIIKKQNEGNLELEELKDIFDQTPNIAKIENQNIRKDINQGIDELIAIRDIIKKITIHSIKIKFDITLARGLDYYTGNVFEVFCEDVSIGSIGGGGRYDNLLTKFGVNRLPSIGISFGIDRIYQCMEQKGLFSQKKISTNQADIMLVNFGDKEILEAMPIVEKIRNRGINLLLFPKKIKLNLQIKYAIRNNINYLLIIGEDEIKEKTLSIKDLKTSTQKKLSIDQLIQFLLE